MVLFSSLLASKLVRLRFDAPPFERTILAAQALDDSRVESSSCARTMAWIRPTWAYVAVQCGHGYTAHPRDAARGEALRVDRDGRAARVGAGRVDAELSR